MRDATLNDMYKICSKYNSNNCTGCPFETNPCYCSIDFFPI